MAGAETPNCTTESTPTATATVAANGGTPNAGGKSTMRRFVGVRQRPSGRWVAEIKDSSQRVRLWLGTYDTPEEAARAYDEAARALRGENARTNFAQVNSITNQLGPMSTPPHLGSAASGSISEGRIGLSFSSLKAKLSKNLQSIMARASDSKSSKSRVSDHFTFASIFHRRSTFQYQANPLDMKNIEKVVQPSIIVPPIESEGAGSWENSSISDCSSEWVGFRQGGLDSDGSDVGEAIGVSDRQAGYHVDQMMGWIDSPEICPSEVSRSKRFKVSSSVMVPPTFSGSPYEGCCSPYSGCSSPYHGHGSPYNYREHH